MGLKPNVVVALPLPTHRRLLRRQSSTYLLQIPYFQKVKIHQKSTNVERKLKISQLALMVYRFGLRHDVYIQSQISFLRYYLFPMITNLFKTWYLRTINTYSHAWILLFITFTSHMQIIWKYVVKHLHNNTNINTNNTNIHTCIFIYLCVNDV